MITQPVLELFDSSDTILEGKQASVVAIGPNMRGGKDGRGNPPGEEQVLGQLLWYSISDALRMTPEVLSGAIEAAGMDPKALLPRAPTLSAALTRSAEGASAAHVRLAAARDGSPYDEEHFANVIFRATGRGNKQAVTEILNADRRRLFYEPFASVEVTHPPGVTDGRLKVESLLGGKPPLPVEAKALEDLKGQLAFERHRHDGEAVRRVMTRALGWARAIPLRNSGGMYFLNRDHAREVEQLLSFVARVAETAASSPGRGIPAKKPRATTVPLVDREEYREVIADSLDDFVDKESRALINEMAALSASGEPVTKKRAEKLIGRVKELKGSVREYEELLETRATAAQANLDVAAKKARALLALVSGG